MGKINSGYPTLLSGVSQQSPESRRRGEHWEQVNMVADPIRGLTRRQGSMAAGWRAAGAAGAASAQDARSFATVGMQVADEQFAVALRRGAIVAGSTLDVAVPVNLSTGAVLPVARPVTDAAVDALAAGGVAAVAPLGRFLVMSGNTLTPQVATTEKWTPAENQKRHVIWVRGGAYSRRFSLTLIRGNQKFTVEYTTLDASYPYALDTSDLLATDPDYLSKVNDRTNAYNTEVTRWVGQALAASTPENIATSLRSELLASSFLSPGAIVTVVGSTLCITDESVEDVEASDGGDGSLIRAVGNTVAAPELLSTVAFPGKVVKVRPQSGNNSVVFYVQALPKDASEGDFTQVSWEECAGVEFQPTAGLCFATIKDGTFYLAGSPAGLRTLTALPFPDYQPNRSGDLETNPPPSWFTNGATALGVFQDRLLIGARPDINTSRIGDYLNFFRGSVVTQVADDPVNFTIIGGEDDTLRKVLVYDRNLVLFGDNKQYLIDGRRPMVPGGTSATVFSPIPDSGAVQPVFAENYMFYVKGGGTSTSLHRFRPGTVDENPVSQELSDVLDSYLPGEPVELVVHDTPNFAFIRTDSAPRVVFCYQFEDYLNGETKQRAWHKWEFDPQLGEIVGIIPHRGYLHLLFHRGAEIVHDKVLLQTDDSGRPYLDSMTPYGSASPVLGATVYVAGGSPDQFVGAQKSVFDTAPPAGTSFHTGYMIPAYVTLSSPQFRDDRGNVIEHGDMTVSLLNVTTRDSGGLAYSLSFGQEETPTAMRLRGRQALAEIVPPTITATTVRAGPWAGTV